MCHKVYYFYNCNHPIKCNTGGIKHCPTGQKIMFTCAAFNPSANPQPEKKDYDCGKRKCCAEALELYRTAMDRASTEVEKASKSGDKTVERLAEAVMKVANEKFREQADWYEKCRERREKDLG